jgi:hypothetical protein
MKKECKSCTCKREAGFNRRLILRGKDKGKSEVTILYSCKKECETKGEDKK